MRLHCCALDRQCRDVGAPPRLYITTKHREIILALTPDAKVQQFGTDWREGKWVWLTWRHKE